MGEIASLLGRRIREIRRAQGLSLERTAELAEVSLTFLGDVERGRKEPSITTLTGIAKALSVSVREIVEVVEVEPAGVSKHELLSRLRSGMKEWYSVEESEAIYSFVCQPTQS
ncbi:MAG: helix-turn-helix transcriptional regulator [Candidatus Eremiobacteraeota bacterium]|nr:helix-turn-helix transcriptional regulator [Candidatus Eremiobacteraeota bacterium]